MKTRGGSSEGRPRSVARCESYRETRVKIEPRERARAGERRVVWWTRVPSATKSVDGCEIYSARAPSALAPWDAGAESCGRRHSRRRTGVPRRDPSACESDTGDRARASKARAGCSAPRGASANPDPIAAPSVRSYAWRARFSSMGFLRVGSRRPRARRGTPRAIERPRRARSVALARRNPPSAFGAVSPSSRD